MAEEFQESEVMFQNDHVVDDCIPAAYLNSRESINNKGKRKKLKTTNKKSSVPVNIPENTWFSYVDSEIEGDGGEMVPPHIIVGRRVAGKMMAFSVCTGNGRTLKGRDLSQVRNSILRKTGFLET